MASEREATGCELAPLVDSLNGGAQEASLRWILGQQQASSPSLAVVSEGHSGGRWDEHTSSAQRPYSAPPTSGNHHCVLQFFSFLCLFGFWEHQWCSGVTLHSVLGEPYAEPEIDPGD